MLTIEPSEKTPLPKRYHYTHNVCAHLYDHLTEILSDFYYLEMAETDLDPSKSSVEELRLRYGDLSVLEILEKENRLDELETVVAKDLVMSLIADLVNFIYESIRIAKSGKMSVAYALLRKPFTDQLLILEQLLIDRKDFINRFYHSGDTKKYDPSDRTIDKRNIIVNAIECLKTIELYDSDFIYEIRYDKNAKGSIYGITNQALHIVTNNKGYATAHRDLNFIFGVNESVEDYWNHYYCVMPMLLNYTAEVVDQIVFRLIKDPEGRKELKAFKRMLSYAMIFNEPNDNHNKQMLSAVGKMLETTCNICLQKNRFSKTSLYNFFYDGVFFCKKCHNTMGLNTQGHEVLKNLLFKT